MNRKKMMPLLLLAAGVVVLAVLLVLLQWSQSRGQQAEIPLCDFSVDAIDQVSYRDDSVEETLIRQGGGVIVNPGVTIGADSVIGSGSVVIRDIPAGVVAVGNPCRVLRPISQADRDHWARLRAEYEAD